MLLIYSALLAAWTIEDEGLGKTENMHFNYWVK